MLIVSLYDIINRLTKKNFGYERKRSGGQIRQTLVLGQNRPGAHLLPRDEEDLAEDMVKIGTFEVNFPPSEDLHDYSAGK